MDSDLHTVRILSLSGPEINPDQRRVDWLWTISQS